MIDESVLFNQLQKIETPLFVDNMHERIRIREYWHACVVEKISREVLQKNTQKILSRWTDELGFKQKIEPLSEYQIVAIDGSQIYPDRHEGINVALLNTGGICLSYGEQESQVQFFSTPEILCENCENSGDNESQTAAFVDCKRHECELRSGLEYVKDRCACAQENKTVCVLFDGSLIFWHLENNPKLADLFFSRYCSVIERLRETDVLCAWYTSLPNSRDLVHIAQAHAQHEINLFSVCDCDVLEFWLQKHERTQVFESTGAHIEKYPVFMRPHFFYVHTGAEIARIEIPAWCVHDQEQINLISRIIIDQCVKGDGYPISCAHAHEQVVVHQRDRVYFQRLVYELASRHDMPITRSRKLIKKRSLGV